MKKFFPYIVMIILTFTVGTSVVKAADYNFTFKAYKVTTEDPDEIISMYKKGQLEEIPANGNVKPGDIIAVATYADVINATGIVMEYDVNWDNELLEPWESYYYADTVKLYTLPGGWTSGGTKYYLKDKPIIKEIMHPNSTPSPLAKSTNLLWSFYKIKDNAIKNKLITFSYAKIEAYSNNGFEEINISSTPVSFKVEGTPERMLGDINNNNKIDVGDYFLIISYTAKSITLEGENLVLADLNNDGKVNLQDYIKMRDYLLGGMDSLEE